MILYAHGFVRDGKINVGLFTQLFWILTVTYIILSVGVFPISPLIRGDFFKTSTGVKICLLKPIKEEGNGRDILKKNIMGLVAMFNCVSFTLYSNKRVSTLLKGFCPKGKMACIGKYRRNMIDYKEARAFSLFTYCILIVDVVLVVIYDRFDLDPKLAFHIDSVVMVLLIETVYFVIVLKLSLKTIPEKEDALDMTRFYARPQEGPIPRRQYEPTSCLPPSPQSIGAKRYGYAIYACVKIVQVG